MRSSSSSMASVASAARAAGGTMAKMKRGMTGALIFKSASRPAKAVTGDAQATDVPAASPRPVELPVGSQAETLSLVTLRTGEELESEVVVELPVGSVLEVLELGEAPRRIRVRAGGREGWVSSRTADGEQLIAKRRTDMDFVTDDFEVGGQHEVKSLVTVRAEETLDSPVVAELRPGSIVRITAMGKINQRRARIVSEDAEGWISVATKHGELLVGKITEGGKAKTGQFGASSSKTKELLEASCSGDVDKVKKIAEGKGTMFSKFTSRPNLNASDIRGKTALIYAAGFGNGEVVHYLLSKKNEVNPNTVDDTQKNALHHASKRAKNKRSPEYDAVQVDIITMLLEAGIEIEARDHNGCTALMFASANGDEAVARRLITAKANPDVKDFEGHRPLDYAKEFRHESIVQLLISAGATEDLTEAPSADACADADGASEGEWGDTGEAGDGGAAETAGGSEAAEAAEAAAEESPQPDARCSVAVTMPEASEAPAAGAEAASVEGGAAAAAAQAASDKPVKKKKDKEGKEGKAEKKEGKEGKAEKKEGKEGKAEKKEKKEKAEGKDEKGEKKEKKTVKDKGEKAGKEKTPKKRASRSFGMMEAVEGEEAQPAVTVVPEPTEEEVVDEKKVALAKLAALVETSTSPGEIEASMQLAQAQGAEEADLAAAKEVVHKLRARQAAQDSLRIAVERRGVAELREALAEAQAHQVPQEALADAQRVLAEEEPKQRARERLQAARGSGNTAELREAISAARGVGLRASELEEFESLLAGAESKEKAEAALRAAIAEANVANLRLAINQAREAGGDAALVKEAEEVLRVEEPKALAREQLAAAVEKPTKEGLRAAVDAARAAGLQPQEFAKAEAKLKAEEEKDRLLAEVRQVLKEVQTVENEIDALRAAKDRLSEAITSALQAGVSEIDLVEADVRRKKLHNAVEDLKGSIRVYCRVRPLSKKEVGQGDTSVTEALDSMTIKVDSQTFQFDSVWTPGTQEEVFEDCRDLVQSAVDGYNVTMFAYGQTGAGKTFTMYGAPGMEGTSPRTIQEIFRVIDKGKDRFNYTVMGSMLELYRNDLVDLLSKGDPKAAKQKLNVRQEKSGAITVEHLTEEECNSAEELSALLERGNAQRTVAATAMNSESSRSHLVLIIRIVSVNHETKEQLRGKILICDLAGSERLKKSQVEAHMQKEAIEINKSLTALGDVIEGLTKGAKVIPYRNHKLTQLMQDALGGTAKTLMFVNCSPANSNLDETLMSLKYAARAKKITNQAAKKG